MSGILEHFNAGGWAMWVILGWLSLVFAIVIERSIYLFGSSISKDVFLSTMQKCILAGDVQKAIKMCSAANAPLARIVQAGLIKVNRPDEEVQAALDEAALRELPKIATRTGYLGLLANLAMLSGLFGTVVGLIKSFGAVSKPGVDQAQKATLLAEGISEAMNCTAFGLIVAIIGLIGFAVLNGKTQGLEDDINEATVQVMNLIVNNRQKVNLANVQPAAAE
jgi:biopolymer transport protein ExbB/TolQ